jgi:hypothetical protein
MGDEVYDCVVQDLLEQPFSCHDFASTKKIIETGRPTLSLKKK